MLSYPDRVDLGELREAVRRFARSEIAPRARRIDQDDWFARQLWPRLGELGVPRPTVAVDDGGPGLGQPSGAGKPEIRRMLSGRELLRPWTR